MGNDHVEPKGLWYQHLYGIKKKKAPRHHIHLRTEEPQDCQQGVSGEHTPQASWGQQQTLGGAGILPCSHLGNKVSVERSESTKKKNTTLSTLKTNQHPFPGQSSTLRRNCQKEFPNWTGEGWQVYRKNKTLIKLGEHQRRQLSEWTTSFENKEPKKPL